LGDGFVDRRSVDLPPRGQRGGIVTADAVRPAAIPVHRRTHAPRGPLAKIVLVLGELLLTFGLIVFLFIFYELKVTDWINAGTQHRLTNTLQKQWQQPVAVAPTTAPVAGKPKPVVIPPIKVVDHQGFAIIRIPRFSPTFSRVVVEGVDEGDLEEGPGHYPGTALPGQIGNVVISAHRTTYGHSFNQLDELQNGDPVTIQVRNVTYTYRVIRTQIVDPSDTAVILPVPGEFGVKPTQRLLTMTTCNPKYSASQRLIVTAEMTTAPTVSGATG
jgi:sortase A